MPGNVTVGLNGSPESFAAVRWAAQEAVLREVALRIIHIQDWPVPPGHVEHVVSSSAATAAHTEPGRSPKYEDLLARAAAEAEQAHPGLSVGAENVTGVGLASKVLLAEAGTPGGMDLLVLGSQGLNRLTGFVIGTTSLPVAAASPCPVVLVRNGGADRGERPHRSEQPAGQLLLGIDPREAESEAPVLDFGFTEAARRSCGLQILHAWSFPPMYAYAQAADPGLGNELVAEIETNLERVVDPWKRRFPGVTVRTTAVAGAPGAELVYASPDADLVVVGRRERTRPVGPRLGHVAHAVIHHATSPVAVVPHP
ncbi:universal stress protein [Streptomyces sp. NPDC020196]|uniref:universal stress protein n=1 Tax=Streptomyces sp. NPDC020196 TaxID=3156656 RepID=UPI0033F0A74A